MPGEARKPQEQMLEILAYRADGTFFSWYRVEANDLLSARNQQRRPAWGAELLARLEDLSLQPSFFDMPFLVDQRVSVELLSFTLDRALVELHLDRELVAVCGLHQTVGPRAGARFSRWVKQSLPMWNENALEQDLLSSHSEAIMFLVQAPGDTARTHWTTIYEGALLMMAAYCRDEP